MMTTKEHPEWPAPGSRVGMQSKLWNDEATIRKAVAEARARAHFRRWPPSMPDAWRKQHGKPE
jgi:hypothetical protein